MSPKTWATVLEALLDDETHLNIPPFGESPADDTAVDHPKLDVPPPDPEDKPIEVFAEDAPASDDDSIPFAEPVDDSAAPPMV